MCSATATRVAYVPTSIPTVMFLIMCKDAARELYSIFINVHWINRIKLTFKKNGASILFPLAPFYYHVRILSNAAFRV